MGVTVGGEDVGEVEPRGLGEAAHFRRVLLPEHPLERPRLLWVVQPGAAADTTVDVADAIAGAREEAESEVAEEGVEPAREGARDVALEEAGEEAVQHAAHLRGELRVARDLRPALLRRQIEIDEKAAAAGRQGRDEAGRLEELLAERGGGGGGLRLGGAQGSLLLELRVDVLVAPGGAGPVAAARGDGRGALVLSGEGELGLGRALVEETDGEKHDHEQRRADREHQRVVEALGARRERERQHEGLHAERAQRRHGGAGDGEDEAGERAQAQPLAAAVRVEQVDRQLRHRHAAEHRERLHERRALQPSVGSDGVHRRLFGSCGGVGRAARLGRLASGLRGSG